MENPPAYDPHANGGAERAVAEVKSQLRAIKICLETRIRAQVNIEWSVLEWMIPHAADVINRFLMGSDGKTAYYRIHHRWLKAPVFEFGEQVWAKPMRETNWNKVTETKRKLSLRSNWIEATWVGFNSRSNEHVVVLPGGGPAMRVRTVRARPGSERWSADAIVEIRATPERPNPHNAKQKFIEADRNTEGTQFGARPKRETAEPKPEHKTAEHQEEQKVKDIRDFRITDAHLQEFGYTLGCPGCDAKRHGTPKRMHTNPCRTRIASDIRAKRPEAPEMMRRDERHVHWAEQVQQAEREAADDQATP